MTIICQLHHLESRCRQRGYPLAEAMACIIGRAGDTITVDTEHPAYPRDKNPSPAIQAVISPTPPDPGTWPRLARWVSTLARPEDQGVGDTVARLISPLGAGEIAARWPRLAGLAGRAIVRLLGADMDAAWARLGGGGCQCASRQAGLNLRYPYPPAG